MLTWALPVVGGVVFLSVVGALRRRLTPNDWSELQAGSVDQKVEQLREHVSLDQALAARLLQKARGAEPERARTLLQRCAQTVEDAIPDRLARTRTMSEIARMAAAIVPTVPVQVRALRLASTSALAALGWTMHRLAVSFEDRLHVRLTTLRWAYGALGAAASALAGRLRPEAAVSVPGALGRADDCVTDLCTLDHEHVECYRQVLTSVAAHPPCCLPADRSC